MLFSYLELIRRLNINWYRLTPIAREEDAKEVVDAVLAKMTPLQRGRIELRLGFNGPALTPAEIAERQAVTVTAVKQSLKKMLPRFAVSIRHFWSEKQREANEPPPQTENPDSIVNLNLTNRAHWRLKGAGIGTISHLVLLTAKDLRKIRGCGERTIQEIRLALANRNMALAGEEVGLVLPEKQRSILIRCPSCRGTGVYVGYAEPEGTGVRCEQCNGTGRKVYKYYQFHGRVVRPNIQIVRLYKGDDSGDRIEISYEDFLAGKIPEGYEG